MRCHSRHEVVADVILARAALAFAGALLWWLIVSAVWGYAFWLVREALVEWFSQQPAFGPIQLLPRMWLRLGRVR